MANKTWTVTVEEDPDSPDECILPFPEDLLLEAGWREGDTIAWTENGDGTWTLTKKEDTWATKLTGMFRTLNAKFTEFLQK